MRISFIDDEPEIYPLQYGGKARTIINLAKALAGTKGVDKVSILSNSIASGKGEFISEGVHFRRLSGYDTIPTLVNEAKVADVLSVHNCSIAFPKLDRAKAVVLYHLHDILISNADRGSHLDKAIGGSWDYIIAPSEFAANVYESFLPQQNMGPELRVIPRALDHKLFRQIDKQKARKKINIDDNQYPVVFLPWRVSSGKGEKYITLLLELLKENYSNPLILTTFSEYSKPDEPCIKNVGWLESDMMHIYYSAADLVISFSLLPESFSQICIEALACGSPFLSFGFGNQKHLASELPAARVCPPTRQGLRKGLDETLDKDLKKEIELSQQVIRSKYSTETIANKYIELFQEAIKNKDHKMGGALFNQTKRYLLSPRAIVGKRLAYFSNEEAISAHRLTAREKAIITSCESPKTLEEIRLTTELDSVKIKATLISMKEKGIVIEV